MIKVMQDKAGKMVAHQLISVNNYQRNFKRDTVNPDGTINVVGVCKSSNKYQKFFNAGFAPEACKWKSKSFYYDGYAGDSVRTKKEAEKLAIKWRNTGREQIMKKNYDLYCLYNSISNQSPLVKEGQVVGDGLVAIPVDVWENYRNLLQIQLDSI